MIRLLRLGDFGKFRGADFPLGPTTVFLGSNESGKTTLFDALLQALCDPPGNQRAGKLLRERYGEELQVELGGDEVPRIAVQDFLGIHAVRGGEVKLVEDRNWVSSLKGRLFSAGVDLQAVGEELERLAGDDRRAAHNKKLARLRQELAATASRLSQLQSQRQDILRQQQQVKKLEGDITSLGKEIAALQEQRAGIQARLDEQRLSQERQQLEQQRRQLLERQRLHRELAEMEPFAADRRPELEQRQQALDAANKLAAGLQGQSSELDRQLDEARRAERELARQENQQQAQVQTARRLQERLTRFCDNRPRRRVTHWLPGRLAAGSLFLLAALAAILLAAPPLGWVLAVASILPGIILLVTARRSELVDDRQAEARFINELREEWNQRHGDQLRIAADTTVGMRTFFEEILADSDSRQRLLAESRERVLDLEARLQELAASRRAAGEQQQAARLQLHSWLQELGLEKPDEYLARRQQRRRLEEMLEQFPNPVSVAAGKATLVEIIDDIDRRLASLDKQGVTADETSAGTIKKLAHQLEQLQERIEQLQRQQASRQQSLSEQRGLLKGRLSDLPEQIRTLAGQQRRLQEQIAELEKNKRAWAIAAGLFSELARDSDRRLAEISDGLCRYLAIMLGRERPAGMTDITEEQLHAVDAGGRERPAHLLSGGTRDAIVLAARLALARQVQGLARLLVLDEPFLALDPQREQGALRMIRQFQQDNDFQLIFFTKEARLRRQVEKLFPGAVIHDLDAPGSKIHNRYSLRPATRKTAE